MGKPPHVTTCGCADANRTSSEGGMKAIILLPYATLQSRVPLQVIGSCNGSGKIVLKDPEAPPDAPMPVDLDLETVLGDLPQKSYEFPEFSVAWAQPLKLPVGESAMDSLERVLRLPSVCSKRFLTTKVDRCVTGAHTCVWLSFYVLYSCTACTKASFCDWHMAFLAQQSTDSLHS
jgi:hypothetical protein